MNILQAVDPYQCGNAHSGSQSVTTSNSTKPEPKAWTVVLRWSRRDAGPTSGPWFVHGSDHARALRPRVPCLPDHRCLMDISNCATSTIPSNMHMYMSTDRASTARQRIVSCHSFLPLRTSGSRGSRVFQQSQLVLTLSPAWTIAPRRRAGITAHALSSSRGLGVIPNSTSQSTTGLSFLSIPCSSTSGLPTHGALRVHIARAVATTLPVVELPPGWTGMNGRTAQITHHERTHWVLSKGWGDEEKAAGSSSLLNNNHVRSF